MATRKKAAKKSAHATKIVVQKPQVTSSMGPTYDTQMIITILLLLFVYPLGLVFMWAWMKTWPLWLKLIISLPLLLSLFVIFLLFYFVGTIIRHGTYRAMVGQQRIEHMQQLPQDMMDLTPTPTYTTY